MRADLGELRARWDRLCREMAVPQVCDDVFRQLIAAYTGPDRHYHGISHIADCLRELDNNRQLATHPVAIELAIWFHDVVYEGRRQDNEERSADLAADALRRMGALPELCSEVRDLILFTRHDRMPPTQDGKLMVDIDLASLGAPEDVFDANGDAIRQEYPHVAEDDFNRGRAAMLGRFLERPRIYYTDAYFVRFERQARENLRRSVAACGA